MTDARRGARTGPEGELIPLAKQDRSLWDRDQIAEGIGLLSATLSKGSVGAYQLQAAIAAVHDEAERAEETDYLQIPALYELLKRMSDNPMVALSHAIAAAMVHGPAAGLKLLETLDVDGRLAGIIDWMRCGLTCWNCRAMLRQRLRAILRRRAARRACRSGIT